jgi:hypothetical protein
MWRRPATATPRSLALVAVSGAAAALLVGCSGADTAAPTSSGPISDRAATTTRDLPTCERIEGGESDLAAYQVKGKELSGDVDGDGTEDRVTLRVAETTERSCRFLLVVELPAGDAPTAPVDPLPWPGTDPKLLLLAEIDGRRGVEPVVALSPRAVYRPGLVFTMRDGELAQMRLEEEGVMGLFPFYDEFPAGVDCAEEPGTIVVTLGRLQGADDSRWHVTRTVYRVAGTNFEPIGDERLTLEVGPEAEQRWPEIGDDPFRTCAGRVG